MEAIVSNENKTFDVYCDKAQYFARGLVKSGENTKERAKELKKKKNSLAYGGYGIRDIQKSNPKPENKTVDSDSSESEKDLL